MELFVQSHTKTGLQFWLSQQWHQTPTCQEPPGQHKGGHLPDYPSPLPKGKWPSNYQWQFFPVPLPASSPFGLSQSRFVPLSELLPICEMGVPDSWIVE